MAASTARRAASRVRAPKTAASNDDDPPEEPKAKRVTSKPVAPVAKPATRTRARPSALVQRVYNTIDGELTKLEKQKGLTSQDRERASRALSQMVNALEKAVEMQRDMTKRKATGGDAKSKEALAHAEDLRREIAERLERLNRKRASGRRSE
jgi:protein subunit release factor B